MIIQHDFTKKTSKLEALQSAQGKLREAAEILTGAGLSRFYATEDIEATIQDLDADINRSRIVIEFNGPAA